MKNKKEDYIKKFDLKEHPEGGYYKETYISKHLISDKELDVSFDGKRSLMTSIYFLIDEGNVSNFHRLKSDEHWYFHDGEPLTIVVIDKFGKLYFEKLGLDLKGGQKPYVIVPAGSIFGSYNEKSFSLVSCAVSYGFDFDDFELFDRKYLLEKYPEYKDIIVKLTRG